VAKNASSFVVHPQNLLIVNNSLSVNYALKRMENVVVNITSKLLLNLENKKNNYTFSVVMKTLFIPAALLLQTDEFIANKYLNQKCPVRVSTTVFNWEKMKKINK